MPSLVVSSMVQYVLKNTKIGKILAITSASPSPNSVAKHSIHNTIYLVSVKMQSMHENSAKPGDLGYNEDIKHAKSVLHGGA